MSNTSTNLFILSVRMLVDEPTECNSGMTEFNHPVHQDMTEQTFNHLLNQVNNGVVSNWFVQDNSSQWDKSTDVWVFGKDKSQLTEMLQMMSDTLDILVGTTVSVPMIMDDLINRPNDWSTDYNDAPF